MPLGMDGGFIERLGDRLLLRGMQWPAANFLDKDLSYFGVELRTGTTDDFPAGGLG